MRANSRLLTPALLLAAVVSLAAEAPLRPPPRDPDAVKALLVTGGHDHDIAFYSVLHGPTDLDVWVDPHPNAFAGAVREDTEVVVLYDMLSEMTTDQQQNLRAFVEGGGGVVALHHAIAGRTGWRWWWEEVLGGRYLTASEDGQPASTYEHDVEMKVAVVAEHPVTAGVTSFRILDETYKGMWISPGNTTLLSTDEPTSDGPVAWVSAYPKARVVFIQLGHGREAHLHPSFRRLVRNAVRWAAGR